MSILLTACVCGCPLSVPDEVSQHEQAWSQCKGHTAACPCRDPNCAHGKDCPYPGCLKSFRDNGTNKIHFLTHLPEPVRPKFSCSICSAEYKYPKDLKSHQRKKHGMLVPSQKNAGTATPRPSLTLEPFQAEPGQGEDTSRGGLVQKEIEGGSRSEDALDAVRSFAGTPQQPWTSQVNMPSGVQPMSTPDATFAQVGFEEPIHVATSRCHSVQSHGDEPHLPISSSQDSYDDYASVMTYPEYELAPQFEPLSALVGTMEHADTTGVETSGLHSDEAMGSISNQGYKRVAEDTLDRGRANTLFIDNLGESAATFQLDWTIEEQQKYNLIIRSLDFVERETRLATIHEPSEGTSDWIFESTADSTQMLPERHEVAKWPETPKWHEFPKWLRSESGVFLILGKAGSGKSTLLKHIVYHKKCETLLGEWATVDGLEHQLITATCCFWRAGSDMQKKKEGLYRSLLTQILEQRRDLTPIALQKHWSRQYHRDVEAERQSWDVVELKKALFRAVEHNILLRFCFFIDGLDEYSDTYALRGLVQDLEKLSELTNVKMCITSRPSVIRTRYFENRPRLILEAFTEPDIRQYVKLELESDQRFQQLRLKNSGMAEKIITELQFRSKGVFLWVYLVTKRLITDLEDMHTLTQLQRTIMLLPPGMEELIDDIMKRIEPDDRMYTARLLLLIETTWNLEVGRAYCLIEEHQNPSSVFGTDAGDITYYEDDDDAVELAEFSSVAEARVKRWCQDLVEIYKQSDHHRYTDAERFIISAVGGTKSVRFAHRTVYDYVKKHHQVSTQREGSTFDVRRATCRLSLLWLRKCLQAERTFDRASARWTEITREALRKVLWDAADLDAALEDGDQTSSLVLHSLNRMFSSFCYDGPLWPFQVFHVSLPADIGFCHFPLDVEPENFWILILSAHFELPIFLRQELTRLSRNSPEACAQICPYILLEAVENIRRAPPFKPFKNRLDIIKSVANHFRIDISARMRFRRTRQSHVDRTFPDKIIETTLWDELLEGLCTLYSQSYGRKWDYDHYKSGLFESLRLFVDIGAFDRQSISLTSDIAKLIAESHDMYEAEGSLTSEEHFQDVLRMLSELKVDSTILQDQWDREKTQAIAGFDDAISSSAISDSGGRANEG